MVHTLWDNAVYNPVILLSVRGNWKIKTEHSGMDTMQGCFQNVTFTELLLKDQWWLGSAVLHI